MTVRTRNWIAFAACVAVLIGAIWIVAEVTSGPAAAAVVGALASIVGAGALITRYSREQIWLYWPGPWGTS